VKVMVLIRNSMSTVETISARLGMFFEKMSDAVCLRGMCES